MCEVVDTFKLFAIWSEQSISWLYDPFDMDRLIIGNSALHVGDLNSLDGCHSLMLRILLSPVFQKNLLIGDSQRFQLADLDLRGHEALFACGLLLLGMAGPWICVVSASP